MIVYGGSLMVQQMEAADIAKFTSLFIINVTALLGNIVMIIVGIRYKPLRKFQNSFIFNMATADLLQAVIIMPSSLTSVLAGRWLLGKSACDAFAILKTTITLSSIFSLSGISLQRYFYIVRQTKRMNNVKHVITGIAFVWLVSLTLAVMPLLGWGILGYSNGRQVCTFYFHETPSHTLTVFISGLLMNVLIMIFCYTNIFMKLHASNKALRHSSITTQHATHNALQFTTFRKQTLHKKFTNGHQQDDHRTVSTVQSPQETPAVDSTEVSWQFQDEIITNSNRDDATVCDIAASPGKLSTQNLDASINYMPRTSTIGNNHTSSPARTNNPITPKTSKHKETIRGIKISSKEIRLLKTIFVVVAVFISCWLPYVMFNTLRLFKVTGENGVVDTLTMWLGFMNSAANPILYGVLNSQFRKAMTDVVYVPVTNCIKRFVTCKEAT